MQGNLELAYRHGNNHKGIETRSTMTGRDAHSRIFEGMTAVMYHLMYMIYSRDIIIVTQSLQATSTPLLQSPKKLLHHRNSSSPSPRNTMPPCRQTTRLGRAFWEATNNTWTARCRASPPTLLESAFRTR